jgi:hypothetical protein
MSSNRSTYHATTSSGNAQYVNTSGNVHTSYSNGGYSYANTNGSSYYAAPSGAAFYNAGSSNAGQSFYQVCSSSLLASPKLCRVFAGTHVHALRALYRPSDRDSLQAEATAGTNNNAAAT